MLYAPGVDELVFTTENTKGTPQRVLLTMAVVIGMGGVPFDKIGTFNCDSIDLATGKPRMKVTMTAFLRVRWRVCAERMSRLADGTGDRKLKRNLLRCRPMLTEGGTA